MTTARQIRTAEGNITRYDNSKLYTLYQAYVRPSTAKERAWNYCVELMVRYNGYGLKVLSYNTFMFTAAFLFTDPENGNTKMMYITPNYDIAIDY